MGKSKKARSAHQTDTKIAENEGNSQNFGKEKNSDFSGFTTSRNSPDLFTAGSSALAYMRDAGVGACGVADLGKGTPAGRVSGGCLDDVGDGRADVSDAFKETVPDSLSSSKSIDYTGTPESMAETVDKADCDSSQDNEGTDVEIQDVEIEESADDSSESDASNSDEEYCKIMNNSNQSAIILDVKKSASLGEKISACKRAGISGSVTLNGIPVDLKAIYGSANVEGATVLPISQRDVASNPNGKAAVAVAKHTTIAAASGPVVGQRAEISGSKSDVNVTANADFNPMHSRFPVVNAIKTWASIVKTNRSPDDEVFELSSEEGELEDDDTLPMEDDDCREEEIEKLRLVGVFSSKFPGRAAVQKMVDSFPRFCNYHYHNSGWIVFCFDSENDAMEVLQSGPYRPYGMPFTLKRMPKFFNFSKEDHSIVPIWIQLPNLPLRFWSKKALSKICSHVGKPLHTDKMTASINVPSFARCLVDVDLSKPRREFLNIRPPKGGKKFKQHIHYENSPPYCSNCKRLGHIASACKGVDYYVTPMYVPRPKRATVPVGANDGKKKNNKKPSTSKTVAAPCNASVPAGTSSRPSGAGKGSATESGAAAIVGTSSGAHSGVKTGPATVSGNVEVRAGSTPISGAVSGGVAGTVSGSDVAQAGFKTPEKGVVKNGLMTPGTYDDPTGPPNKKKKNKKRNKKRKDHG